jgi:hypothetical protein
MLLASMSEVLAVQDSGNKHRDIFYLCSPWYLHFCHHGIRTYAERVPISLRQSGSNHGKVGGAIKYMKSTYRSHLSHKFPSLVGKYASKLLKESNVVAEKLKKIEQLEGRIFGCETTHCEELTKNQMELLSEIDQCIAMDKGICREKGYPTLRDAIVKVNLDMSIFDACYLFS